jgi:hypothetical protein
MKPTPGKGFIRYQTRSGKDNPSVYGIFCPSCHGSKKATTDGNKDLWLGKVIDKANGIFFNSKDGYFKFTIESGIQQLSKSETEIFSKLDQKNNKYSIKHVKSYSINFGEIFVTWV